MAEDVAGGVAPHLPVSRRAPANFLKVKEVDGVGEIVPRNVSLAGVVPLFQMQKDKSLRPFSSLGPVGGCLATFAGAWTARETDPLVT